MMFHSSGRLFVAWHNRETPHDPEWSAVVAALRAHDHATLRVLVVTEGGTPSRAQQQALTGVLAGKAIPVAVVSDATAVRFVASALALFMKRIKTFRSNELAQAYAHLGLTEAERRDADAFLAERPSRPSQRAARGSV